MSYLLCDKEELVIGYKANNGAWTHYIEIPQITKTFRWGQLRLSGTLDQVDIGSIFLAPRKNTPPVISINKTIREQLGKDPGQTVHATLYLTIEGEDG